MEDHLLLVYMVLVGENISFQMRGYLYVVLIYSKVLKRYIYSIHEVVSFSCLV